MMEGGWPVLENHHLANAGCPKYCPYHVFPPYVLRDVRALVFLPACWPKSRIQFMICAYMCYIYTTGNIYILCILILCYINHSCHVDVCIYIYICTNPMMDGKRNPNVSLPRLLRIVGAGDITDPLDSSWTLRSFKADLRRWLELV